MNIDHTAKPIVNVKALVAILYTVAAFAVIYFNQETPTDRTTPTTQISTLKADSKQPMDLIATSL